MIYLRWLRKEKQLSQQQLADKMGLSRSTIAMWESGSSQPDNNALFRLSEILSAPMELIICKISEWTEDNYKDFSKVTDDGTKLFLFKQLGVPYDLAEYYHWLNNKTRTPKKHKIKILGYVRAGSPVEAVEEVIGYEEISDDMAKHGEHFALIVRGDSMEPKFSEGDVVIVRQQATAESGDIVVALINGDEATIKKINISKNGIVLQPLNPAYKALFYSPQEVTDLPLTIIGKVIELRARFE